MDSKEKKFKLQQKFHQALIEEVDDPDVCLFEIPGVVDFSFIMKLLKENARSLNDPMNELREFQKFETTNRKQFQKSRREF